MDKRYQELDTYMEVNNNLIMVLHKAEELWGYLPKEVLIHIAGFLHIPIAKIYGVVTFYSRFELRERGKYVIDVCMGTACFVNGSEGILDEFKRILKIDIDETTEDNMFTLASLRCIGACGLAPVVSVNGKIYSKVKKSEVINIINECKEGKND